MIAALALLAVSEVRVLELPEDQPYIVVQAYVKAPEMTEREAAAWQVLGRVLLQGTVEYTPQVIRDYGSQAGVTPSVTVMPDFLRLQVVVPKGGLKLAGDLVFSVLTRPALLDEDVAKAVQRLTGEQHTAWANALVGLDFRYDRLRAGDVKSIWLRAVRPENMNFVVGGAIDPGQGAQELQSRFETWTAPRDTGGPRFDNQPKPVTQFDGGLSAFLLSGRTMTPASPSGAARLLSVFALGVGQGSAMNRVLREQLGLSYLQGAVLWPTKAGWVPDLLMVRKSEDGEAKYATQMKEALAKDVDSWNSEALQRAQALAAASFSRDLQGSPFWLGPDGPMSQTLFDRCAWRGYLEMVGSGALRENVLVGAMQNVDLDQLKAAAKSLLEECNVGWVPGRP